MGERFFNLVITWLNCLCFSNDSLSQARFGFNNGSISWAFPSSLKGGTLLLFDGFAYGSLFRFYLWLIYPLSDPFFLPYKALDQISLYWEPLFTSFFGLDLFFIRRSIFYPGYFMGCPFEGLFHRPYNPGNLLLFEEV